MIGVDTSKEYIEQCKKAWEIQKAWEPTIGDWYCYSEPEVIGHEDFIPNILANKNFFTFLPNQAQLQKMVPINCNCGMPWLHQIGDLENFADMLCDNEEMLSMKWAAKSKQFHVTKSWEQFWLSYVYVKLYNKTWNGNNWRKK